MGEHQPDETRRPRPAKRTSAWLAWASSFLAGSVTTGLAVNAISDRYPGAAPVAVVAAVVAVLAALSQRQRQAPLFRMMRRTALATAVVAIIVAVLVPTGGTGWAVLAAATFAVIGCLNPAPARTIVMQLASVSVIGLGVVSLGVGVQVSLDNGILIGGVFFGLGAAMIGSGAADLVWGSDLVAGASTAVGGLGVASYGVMNLRSDPQLGAAFIGVGVALSGVGFAPMLRLRVGALIVLASGMAAVGLGAALALRQDLPLGLTIVCLGMAVVAAIVGGFVAQSALTVWISLIVAAAALIGVGIVQLQRFGLLAGAAIISLGVASAGYGAVRTWTTPGVSSKLRSLTQEPPARRKP